eukprot:27441-Prorocentrum_lima.AAC.1
MVPPGFITVVTAPSNQGQAPALTAPTDQDVADQPMGTPYETPMSTNWRFGQHPEAHRMPQAFTPDPHVARHLHGPE